jgi:alkylhydroperoxidase/carboxymuconolactone decarboxylase family protein YurZ
MQIYWEAYNSPNMTNKDDHEAACCKAIRHCMNKGATQSQILKLVDTKAPMAVWEKDGQYAIRTVGEVNREREAAKESNTDRSR